MPATASTTTPLADQDHLDTPVRTVPARLWAAALALAIVLGAGGAWAAYGSVSQHLTLSGTLLHGYGPAIAVAPATAAVQDMRLHVGERVNAGERLATLVTADGTTMQVNAPDTGLVVRFAAEGSTVAAGTPVAVVDPVGKPASVQLWVTAPGDLARLRPGEPVTGVAGGVPFTGRVARVLPYATTPAAIAGTFGAAAPGLHAASDAQVWIATVRLGDANLAVPALADVRVSVSLGSKRPYQLVGGSR